MNSKMKQVRMYYRPGKGMLNSCNSWLLQPLRAVRSTSGYMLLRPPVRSNGRTYKMLVMFFFLSPGSLRAPSTDRRETMPHDRKLIRLDKFSPKIRGALPPKKWGGKNMQNFGQFWTTSDFHREYLRNGATYPKSERRTN